MRVLVAITVVLWGASTATARQITQPQPAAIPFPNQVPEPIMYRMLLHHAAAFEIEARRLEAVHEDGGPYRRHIAKRLHLTPSQTTDFMNLALEHRAAEEALHQKYLPLINRIRDRYLSSGTVSDRSSLPPPPPELESFTADRDALALQYRDRWHRLLGESAFARVESVIKNELRANYQISQSSVEGQQGEGDSVVMPLTALSQINDSTLPASVEQKLKSGSWQVRREGFLSIGSRALDQRDGQEAVIGLLRKESLDVDTLQSVGEDMTYEDYLDKLQRAVQQIAANGNVSAMRALLESPYNGFSSLGLWISSRKEALPVVMEYAERGEAIQRMSAICVLSEMVIRGDGRQPRHDFPEEVYPLITLKPSERLKAKKLIISSLDDESVRYAAIEALAEIGDKGDLQTLQNLQKRNPHTDFGPIFAHAIENLKAQNER